MVTLKTRHATATVNPYGAQVMSFIPEGGHDVLWQTTPEILTAAENGGKALRGGIPVCWPWFRTHPTLLDAPSHGLARTQTWTLESESSDADRATVIFAFETDGTHPAFPHKARVQLVITLTDSLLLQLTTTNTGTSPMPLTQALHTYLRVSDVSAVVVEGLEGLPRKHISSWIDQAPHQMLRVDGEIEHLYKGVKRPIHVEDKTHTLTVETTSDQVVVWNPWIEKATILDMPADGYQTMLCIEAANVEPILSIAPGSGYTLATRLSVRIPVFTGVRRA